jgi:hypothetical protein
MVGAVLTVATEFRFLLFHAIFYMSYIIGAIGHTIADIFLFDFLLGIIHNVVFYVILRCRHIGLIVERITEPRGHRCHAIAVLVVFHFVLNVLE